MLKRLASSNIAWIIGIGIALLVIQIVATVITANQVEHHMRQIVANLQPLQDKQLSDEKARQEVLTLRIQNEMRGFLWNSLLLAAGPMITAFVALVGALLGLRNYLDARETEHRDRQDVLEKDRQEREKERLDRAAAELKDTMERLVDPQPLRRTAGIVGLQHFLTPDMREYHLRALSALVMAARNESDAQVQDSIRIAIEQAVRSVGETVLQQVVWQGVKLRGAKFAEHPLRGLDFRDAVLEDADFSDCDLSGSRFINATLNGAKFDRCVLRNVDFSYADFAGASLVKTNLSGATLFHAKVLQMDLDGADLRAAKFDPDLLPWDLVQQWRNAVFDAGLKERLIARYGPQPRGLRVLMLMWEIPPLVAGGSWTACYHLVRNLRRHGADVKVVVPWDQRSIMESLPFGCEVEVLTLGIVPPGPAPSPYGTSASPIWSPYGTSYSAEPLGSPYARTTAPPWSPYAAATPYYLGSASYGATMSGYATTRGMVNSSTVLRLMDECRRALMRLVRTQPFDLIHAHDWVTFDAAAAVAQAHNKPWIAHFHSTERERRPQLPDAMIERIERQAAWTATRSVAPSAITAKRIAETYEIDAAKITVAPNTLSREHVPPAQLGSFETRRTVFVGRLTWQKGPDRFAKVAEHVRKQLPDVQFWVYGVGEDFSQLRQAGVWMRGSVDWTQRGTAFSDASAVLLPSRAEPFGMVVLEAMQHRVPVLYPQDAGAAEVLKSGIRIAADDIAHTAERLHRLLTDRSHWEETAQAQSTEIAAYPDRGYEKLIIELWSELNVASPATHAANRR